MSLLNALQDLKTEVLNGKSSAELIADVAADYGLNARLLERKFVESYTSDDTIRANATQVAQSAADTGRVQAMINKICAFYNVSPADCHMGTYKGTRYTIIGRRSTKLVMISHRDGEVWNLKARFACNIHFDN